MKKIIEKIEATAKTINPRYSLKVKEIDEIRSHGEDMLSFGSNCFTFGYMQGMKVAKAEAKKKGFTNPQN